MLFYILVGVALLVQNAYLAEIQAKQQAECGTLDPGSKVPWHTTIYNKLSTPYTAWCGGTLVSEYKIITVAHCFWSAKERSALPASDFAVAVSKQVRSWDSVDENAQKSDVKAIRIPAFFHGEASRFESDIAVVTVMKPFEINKFVRPVCLDFDIFLELDQLQDGNKGKIAGWTVNSLDGRPSSSLQVLDMPYVDLYACLRAVHPTTMSYITSDKLCAGTLQPGSAVCTGDNGVGLTFPATKEGVTRFYLRGVASVTAGEARGVCNTSVYTLFTRISRHEAFIRS